MNYKELVKKYKKEKKNYKEPNLNLTMSNPEIKTLVIPSIRKTDTECPQIKITFFK